MWKAIAVSAALLVAILVLSKLQSGRPGLDPKEELAFERQRAARLQMLRDQRAQFPPAMRCVAERSSEVTAQTLYLVWLNRRPDLVTVSERDDASQDVARLIATCGGDLASLEAAAHRDGFDLDEAAAMAMLMSGR